MNEDFLHYIWKYRLFRQEDLLTPMGEAIHVLKPGLHNTHAGPDFFNARVKIGSTVWAGNVEVHLRASDWRNHHHHKDRSYDNVILHVVEEADEPVFRMNGKLIPVLSLKGKYDPSLWENYAKLLRAQSWIPCGSQVKEVDEITISSMLDRMLAERLEMKAGEIQKELKENLNNWEESFYHFLARNFGFKTNSGPFEMLARSLPLSCLARNKNNLSALEALLFGQAGLLHEKCEDEYPRELRKEYEYLRKKFSLSPLESHTWKFLRMRPANFPTIRIAQFARLVNRSSHLFSRVLECDTHKKVEELFVAEASGYWKTHFIFDSSSPPSDKSLGMAAIHNIIINTIVPFLFVYGVKKKIAGIKDRALSFLEHLPPEKNSLIRNWEGLGLHVPDAHRSQGLIQLKNEYCFYKKCLTCSIGNKILNQE